MLGILTFGVENIICLRRLREQKISTLTLMDDLSGPLDDLPLDHAKMLVLSRCAWLREQGCTQLLVSPLWELRLIEQGYNDILPLFSSYLALCLGRSLIGKLGFVMTRNDALLWAEIGETVLGRFAPTDTQKKIGGFHYPYAQRSVCVPVRQSMIKERHTRNFLVNSTIKHDLRPLKDAGVDTIMMSQWSFFAYQRTIARYFSGRRYRFADDSVVREILLGLITPSIAGVSHRFVYTGAGNLCSISQWQWTIAMGSESQSSKHCVL